MLQTVTYSGVNI